ncbi:MAG TPA: NAD(P)/FAD-dependent oxidoreductase [Solirubrobacterales bacterium]|nr:NAD(P)/FAD-dependent oxidoreductase [Solirubrobacterales bacterium]
MNEVAAQLGEVGLPAPVSELAARDWDVVVIGGGHNGLTAAAYLARAGRSVLVLERRERLGGACTLERPFADERFRVSPCAYVLGLLDERVIAELGLKRRGLNWWLADPNLWIPFADGSSLGQFVDDAQTQQSLEALGVSAADIDGYWRHQKLYDDARKLLRKGERDAWEGDSPDRAEIEEMLGGDQALIDIVFDASIADVMTDHFSDRRLHDALFGGGVIGTWAGPRDSGTASVKLMHHQGDLDGRGSNWAYVEGGMGMVSFAIADAAREAGAELACGVPVGRVEPGEGVELTDGTTIRAAHVVCNADPKVALGLLGAAAIDSFDSGFRERLEAWDVRSPVVKLNAALDELPDWSAAAGETWPARAMIELTDGIDAAQAAFERCREGEPAIGFAEVYTQTGFDPSPAPAGKHSMTVFAQYAPYELTGGWEARRDEVGRMILDLIDRFAPGIDDRLIDYEVLGPPDIEARIGLTGGQIFQGSVLPEQMWDRRLAPRTPIPGFWLCGAATHPGGSVIATNGRNAAAAVLAS